MNFLKEILEANEAGNSFEDDNPAVSYEIRSALLGMAHQMAPIHRALAAAHPFDDTKV